ncbi:RNA-directed DNA polymerase from mobile element jockey [Stylophora pistillata]|uniref:RNA-directed DNA polymerase from mobile element jockey n=1 Tax=Stylophora pistillata TaxID=50429 RepID=A0A2B4SCT6_STYPI|nr:RNA-directed DNA polymerase from mobile element jockey [Stylophora pistillata]
MLALEICPNPTTCVLFSTFYRPPEADESFLVHFKGFLAKYSETGLSNLIVAGDFNFPHVNWYAGCPTCSDVGTEDFCNILDDYFLLQLNLNPTHNSTNVASPGNILDLVLTSNESLVKEKRSRPPWIDNDVMRLIRKKKKRLWKLIKSGESAELFEKFKVLRRVTKKRIDTGYRSYLHIPCLRNYKKTPGTFGLSNQDVINPNLLSDLSVSALDVQKALPNINLNKAPGPDQLPPRILRRCAEELSTLLAHLFHLSLRSGVMPKLWKSANITPVHKGDKKEFVENYRSISLLPIPAKCLEIFVYDAIYDHIFPYLTEWQHGFVKGRSCVTQLILTYHHWAKALDGGCQVNVAFLDFSKAFDRVSHSVLLEKLCSFGVSGSLLRWCESYFTDRRQRVLIDGVSSSWVVLPGNTIALYADDCKSSRTIDSADDIEIYHQDLENFERWSTLNGMDFDVKKCKIVRITRKKQPFTSTFFLNNTELEQVEEFKDLGVITDHHLKWNSRVNCVVAKANRTLGLIKRICKGLNDLKTLRTLYCSLVRSNLEYCSEL